jgi:hypothetical protein
MEESAVVVGMAALILAPAARQPAAQQLAAPPQQRGASARRFDFQVVESFDARYLGDTPGHIGRGGGLGTTAPKIALGDPVFHGDERVGIVSGLKWDRVKEGLEVEIAPEEIRVDPAGKVLGRLRITIGQELWIPLDMEPARKPADRD